MQLWLIHKPRLAGSDYEASAVVRAATEDDARSIADSNMDPEGLLVWPNGELVWFSDDVTCVPVEREGKPGVLLSAVSGRREGTQPPTVGS